ncbi:MAG: helix-turn-helix transcriptional regulator [Hyphomicrobiaceae bacterium]|nr:helix-turn-helix transcriptional regulator [Hyphomicrobiaceae bacterium]MCC0024027.1 helix-turn-helix transcriptional regulator [Hyphomicrobiaceae bacterium]
MLKAIGNERRLVILCQLVSKGEMSVSELTKALSLGQSALSQHLAVMREEGIVTTRREGQSIYYKVGDDRVRELMRTFHNLYCDMESV